MELISLKVPEHSKFAILQLIYSIIKGFRYLEQCLEVYEAANYREFGQSFRRSLKYLIVKE